MNTADNTYPYAGWLLRIAEVSNGHFAVSLTDDSKRRVALTCADAELPMKVQQCIVWAQQIDADNSAINNALANG